jgi:hypothetical protein
MKGARYAETIDRIMTATKSKTETALAKALGVKPQSVSQAKKKGGIPAQWFVCIALKHGVSLDWLVSGRETAHEAGNSACPRCVALYEKLIAVQERENALLKENGELRSRLSLSAAADGKSPHTSVA